MSSAFVLFVLAVVPPIPVVVVSGQFLLFLSPTLFFFAFCFFFFPLCLFAPAFLFGGFFLCGCCCCFLWVDS
jgi:hypothetical protein